MTRFALMRRPLFDRGPIRAPGPASPYQGSLVALLTRRRHISVAVTGANDGKVNDPLNRKTLSQNATHEP